MKARRVNIKEKDLQKMVEDFLNAKKVDFFHIPDSLWKVLYYFKNKFYFFKCLGSLPDIILYQKTNKRGIYKCLFIELKTKYGSLHGKQKLKKADWIICKDFETAKSEIERFLSDV